MKIISADSVLPLLKDPMGPINSGTVLLILFFSPRPSLELSNFPNLGSAAPSRAGPLRKSLPYVNVFDNYVVSLVELLPRIQAHHGYLALETTTFATHRL